MKKTMFIILICSLFTVHVQAQLFDTTEVNLEALTLKEKTWLTTHGFSINSYDLSQETINQKLQSSLMLEKQGATLITASWIAMGAGVLASLIPSVGAKGSNALYVVGGVGLIGGFTVNLMGISKRKKAINTLAEAQYLLDESN